MSVRVVDRRRPADLALYLQGVVRVHPCGLPPELDQQQGEEGTQRYRRLVQLLQVRVRDLQGALPQDRHHDRGQDPGHDHDRQAPETLPDAGDRERQGRHQEGEEPAHDLLERGTAAEGGQGPPVRDARERHLGVAGARRDPVHEQQVLPQRHEVQVRHAGQVQGGVPHQGRNPATIRPGLPRVQHQEGAAQAAADTIGVN